MTSCPSLWWGGVTVRCSSPCGLGRAGRSSPTRDCSLGREGWHGQGTTAARRSSRVANAARRSSSSKAYRYLAGDTSTTLLENQQLEKKAAGPTSTQKICKIKAKAQMYEINTSRHSEVLQSEEMRAVLHNCWKPTDTQSVACGCRVSLASAAQFTPVVVPHCDPEKAKHALLALTQLLWVFQTQTQLFFILSYLKAQGLSSLK